MNDNRESFVARWSRRKAIRPTDQGAPELARNVAAECDFADVDFSALDINSDFTRFMQDNVPDSIRSRALQMLWASSDVIGKPDDLDDFLEDFSEEAMALPSELAKSAYKIGAGFVFHDANSSDTDDGDVAESEETLQKMGEAGPENHDPKVAPAHDPHADDV